jgi:UDP-N-acetylmuramoylalanine--D-glutamate ligase
MPSVSGVVGAAQASGVACGNELKSLPTPGDLKTSVGYALSHHPPGPMAKTTVTSLTGQLVERAGKTVAVAGNIGPTCSTR